MMNNEERRGSSRKRKTTTERKKRVCVDCTDSINTAKKKEKNSAPCDTCLNDASVLPSGGRRGNQL